MLRLTHIKSCPSYSSSTSSSLANNNDKNENKNWEWNKTEKKWTESVSLTCETRVKNIKHNWEQLCCYSEEQLASVDKRLNPIGSTYFLFLYFDYFHDLLRDESGLTRIPPEWSEQGSTGSIRRNPPKNLRLSRISKPTKLSGNILGIFNLLEADWNLGYANYPVISVSVRPKLQLPITTLIK